MHSSAGRRRRQHLGHDPVIVVEPLDRQQECSILTDFCAAVWSGSDMHTDTLMIRGREVPQWATALEVRPVRPAERAR